MIYKRKRLRRRLKKKKIENRLYENRAAHAARTQAAWISGLGAVACQLLLFFPLFTYIAHFLVLVDVT